MQRSRSSYIRWVVLGLVLLAFAGWRITIGMTGPKLEFGPQTTVVTGPRTSDGRIDYAAALDQRLSEGIDTKDNAAILINRAFGPNQISAELRSQYFDRLKIEPLPEKGDYVVTQAAFTQRKAPPTKSDPDSKDGDASSGQTDVIFKEFTRALSRPWTRDQCPLVAEWLIANTAPMELITQAAKLTDYYSPLVTAEGLKEGDNNSQSLREAARLLTTRAMYRIEANDVTGAWNDLLTCHRLARLASRHVGTSNQFLIAISVELTAMGGDTALLSHGLTSEQARKFQSDFARLPEFGLAAEVMDRGDRLLSVDSILRQTVQFVDLNLMLRQSNAVYNDLVTVMKTDAYAKRRKSFLAIEAELKGRSAAASQPVRQTIALVTGSRKMVTESIGTTLLALVIPSAAQTDTAATRRQTRCDQIRVGLALAAYRADKKSYPKTIENLVPKYLESLPTDGFSGNPFVYVPREKGYILYSVGPNNKDEEGRNGGTEKADDISLEIPMKAE